MREWFEDLDEETKAILEAISEAVEAEAAEPQILNVQRMHDMVQAYSALKNIADDDWKISSFPHAPYPSMGVISVEADDIIVTDMAELNKVFAKASNIEIYPLTNGKIRMSVTFHGITNKID